MINRFGLKVGDTVEITGTTCKGKWEVVKIYPKMGEVYFDMRNTDGLIEDFSERFLSYWTNLKDTENEIPPPTPFSIRWGEDWNYVDTPSCVHEWRTDVWIRKVYKTCKKCGKKWEEYNE